MAPSRQRLYVYTAIPIDGPAERQMVARAYAPGAGQHIELTSPSLARGMLDVHEYRIEAVVSHRVTLRDTQASVRYVQTVCTRPAPISPTTCMDASHLQRGRLGP